MKFELAFVTEWYVALVSQVMIQRKFFSRGKLRQSNSTEAIQSNILRSVYSRHRFRVNTFDRRHRVCLNFQLRQWIFFCTWTTKTVPNLQISRSYLGMINQLVRGMVDYHLNLLWVVRSIWVAVSIWIRSLRKVGGYIIIVQSEFCFAYKSVVQAHQWRFEG